MIQPGRVFTGVYIAFNTDTQQCKQCKCYVHVECALDDSCLQCAQPICPPCPPPTKTCTFHTSWQSGRPWRTYENGVMCCAACRAHPQLAAQPEWIVGITNLKWFKIAKHQKCGTHAVSLALWRSGGRVRHVTHTLPASIYKYVYTHFLIQTPNQPCKRWENATWGHKAQATNHKTLHYLFMSFAHWLSC